MALTSRTEFVAPHLTCGGNYLHPYLPPDELTAPVFSPGGNTAVGTVEFDSPTPEPVPSRPRPASAGGRRSPRRVPTRPRERLSAWCHPGSLRTSCPRYGTPRPAGAAADRSTRPDRRTA